MEPWILNLRALLRPACPLGSYCGSRPILRCPPSIAAASLAPVCSSACLSACSSSFSGDLAAFTAVAGAVLAADSACALFLMQGAARALDAPGRKADRLWATARFGSSEPCCVASFPPEVFAIALFACHSPTSTDSLMHLVLIEPLISFMTAAHAPAHVSTHASNEVPHRKTNQKTTC
jgi:hypothetical protein